MVVVDFWSVYEAERAKPGFGAGRTYIRSRDRIHVSLSAVEDYAVQLGMDNGTERRFSENARYAIATDITRDMFLSVHDVNTTHTILLRFSDPLDESAMKRVTEKVRLMRKPNLEMRIIGLQDNETELLNTIDRIRNEFKSSLMEVDLFGTETRHIAFDLKLGMSFNLLLLNRVYGPNELLNTTMKEEFEKKKSEFKFV